MFRGYCGVLLFHSLDNTNVTDSQSRVVGRWCHCYPPRSREMVRTAITHDRVFIKLSINNRQEIISLRQHVSALYPPSSGLLRKRLFKNRSISYTVSYNCYFSYLFAFLVQSWITLKEVITAVSKKAVVFWVVSPSSLVELRWVLVLYEI